MSSLQQPIYEGHLVNAFDARNEQIVNILRLVLGGSTGTAAVHLSPGATPTGATAGIWFGDDVKLYRGNTRTLRLEGFSGAPVLHMSSGTIANLADPTNPQDAATRAWCLANFSGLGTQNASTAFNAGTVPHEYGGLKANVSGYSGVPLISGNNTIELKYNRAATTAPGPSNNTTQGYTIGSRWVDINADEEYVCLESTSLTAVWKRTTVVDVGGGSASELSELSDVGTAPQNANYVLATPNGSSGPYSGRALADADIPNLAATKITSDTLRHERGGLEADVSNYAGIPLINNGITSQLKMNLGANSDPGASNDNIQGYTVGSRWVNLETDTEYVCVNNATGAASWIATTTGGSSGANALADLTDVTSASGTQNFVLAAPASGGSGLYSGRLLADSDIPAIPASKITSGTLPLTQGGLGVNAVAFSGIPLITGSTTVNLKCNFTAESDPLTSDNTIQGYRVGSRWVNTLTNKEFVCVKATNPATWVAVLADPTTVTGDLVYRAANGLTRLGRGSVGQVLTSTGSSIEWAPGGFVDPMQLAGDLIYRNTLNVTARLPRGNAGEFLKVINGNTGALGWGAGMTDLTSTAGDLMYRDANGVSARLAAGSVGQFLKVTGTGAIGWAAPPDTGMTDPTSAAGDLIYRNSSNVLTRLAAGATGQFLKVTSAGTVAWGTGMVDPTNVAGDLIYRNSSNVLARLDMGAQGQVLTVTNAATNTIGWSNSAGMTDPMQLAGDLIYRNGNNVTTRLPVGSVGEFLKVTSTGAIGWGSGGMTNVMTNPGDIIYGGTNGAPTRLGIGTAGQQLRVSGTGSLQYFTPSGSVPSGIVNADMDFMSSSYTIQSSDMGKLFITVPGQGTYSGDYNIILPGAPSIGNVVWITHNGGTSYPVSNVTLRVIATSAGVYYNGETYSPFSLQGNYTIQLWYSGSTYGWVVITNSHHPNIPYRV